MKDLLKEILQLMVHLLLRKIFRGNAGEAIWLAGIDVTFWWKISSRQNWATHGFEILRNFWNSWFPENLWIASFWKYQLKYLKKI